ncbi:MAG: biopolymer transporter ExbD [Candidatus Omnitrophica bacterium]|nr:biopolymer transporter ExbD [Candidatus Omnitrophota bacterium]
MRFKKTLTQETGLRQFDIAPFINVVFLLLIFFILTSNFISVPGMNLKLPRTITSEIFNAKTLTIVISNENIMYVEGKPLAVKDMQNYIQKGNYRSVFLKADRNTDLGSLVKIWDICKNLGIEKIGIATTHE